MNDVETSATVRDRASQDAEAKRVSAVAALDLFGESIELAYDDAVYLASLICGTPVSLISVLEEKKQRFKAKIGTELTETPKDESFCIHTIQQKGLFIVPDARLDSRFCNLPLVTEDPNLRFYAGVTLSTIQGDAVGALCVCDTIPRELTEDQKAALMILSRQVAGRFHDRQKISELAIIIAEKDRIAKELQTSHALFYAFMDNSPLVGYLKDREGRLVYYNQPFARNFAITRDAWIGKNEYDSFPAEAAKKAIASDRAVFESDELNVAEESIPASNGSVQLYRIYRFTFTDASGNRLLAGLAHEISSEKKALQEIERYHQELRKANERLRELSLTDPLTGCWNRRAFDEKLSLEFAACERHGGDLSVLLLDIDNFKQVNDTYGHEVGDKVICHVAKILKESGRGTDFVCRYGGEEFAVLLPRTRRQGAALIAERLRDDVAKAWDGCLVTVSIGIGARCPDTYDPATMIRHADEALYQAKAAGKNRVMMAA